MRFPVRFEQLLLGSLRRDFGRGHFCFAIRFLSGSLASGRFPGSGASFLFLPTPAVACGALLAEFFERELAIEVFLLRGRGFRPLFCEFEPNLLFLTGGAQLY